MTTLVPANAGIINNAKNPKAAAAFVEFILSDEGQAILLDPKIRRLPVRPETYAKAPADYPNPFKDTALGARVKFDADVSETRYELVNSLYDRLVTFRLKELNEAWKAIQTAEAAVAKKSTPDAQRLLADARKRATAVPITEKQGERRGRRRLVPGAQEGPARRGTAGRVRRAMGCRGQAQLRRSQEPGRPGGTGGTIEAGASPPRPVRGGDRA